MPIHHSCGICVSWLIQASTKMKHCPSVPLTCLFFMSVFIPSWLWTWSFEIDIGLAHLLPWPLTSSGHPVGSRSCLPVQTTLLQKGLATPLPLIGQFKSLVVYRLKGSEKWKGELLLGLISNLEMILYIQGSIPSMKGYASLFFRASN